MANPKVLIVEDDKHISKLVRYNLEKAGYYCHVVITGEDALDILDREAFDLVILDVMLPKMNGLDVCKEMRKEARFKHLPVIMLTARGEEVDRVVGLELGADDYMVKPFSPRELVLRVKAILRRGQQKENIKEILTYGPITIDIPRHKVTVNKKEVDLTAMEFNLLKMLLERKGRVQSRDRLLEEVWGMSSDVTTRTIDTHVKLLRQKLGRSGKLIETVRGIGYKIRDE
jgi:DNA-binding response OmpR family regulator